MKDHLHLSNGYVFLGQVKNSVGASADRIEYYDVRKHLQEMNSAQVFF